MVKFSTCSRCHHPFEQSDTTDHRMCDKCRAYYNAIYEKNKIKDNRQKEEYQKGDYWSALGYGSSGERQQLQWTAICPYCGTVLDKNGECPNGRCSKNFEG
jgi:hypothetical protein